jgi:hypothetical protein
MACVAPIAEGVPTGIDDGFYRGGGVHRDRLHANYNGSDERPPPDSTYLATILPTLGAYFDQPAVFDLVDEASDVVFVGDERRELEATD